MDRFVNKKIEKQTIYEIYRACRLCGAGGGYKMPIIQNVVNLDNCDVELKQKIRECVQIEVHQDDKMPPLICELCVDKVNDFYEFLEMCRQTNKRTRLKLGLPPQMMPRGAPDAGDCILGVTEPIFVNDEDSNEPLSDKKSKAKGGKVKKEPEKKWKDVKVEKITPRESRSSRQRPPSPPSPPRLRRDRRPDADSAAHSRLQSKVTKGRSPPPKSILKKGVQRQPEASPQSPTTRLKRSREQEAKPETPAKKVKISLKPVPSRSVKLSPRRPSSRHRRGEAERRKMRQREARQKEIEAQRQAKETQTPCSVCGAFFKTLSAMISHRRCHVVTFTNPKLACNPCGLWFPSAEEAERHHRRHRRQALRYRCRRCSYSATKLHGYQEHIEKGKCIPWEEVPDVKCETCWRTFPTRNLLNGHRCQGPGARPGSCAKCGRRYASQKSLASHTRYCKKGDVVIPPEMRDRLKPMRVRVAKCDPLLANVKQEHYDVSSVGANFGLDKNCVYPYISSGLRIKSEPSDCMVKINDLDFASYVHWDSDDDSGDSDADNLDSLDFSTFTKKRKVDSLAACALRIIFSSKLLGKVPRKFRRVKIETIIDSTLNDSLSDLNLNDGEAVSTNKVVTISDDKLNDSDNKIDENEDDDLFPKVNSDKIITNDDFNTLFSDNNKTNNGDSGDKSVEVSDDKLVSLEDKTRDDSKSMNFDDSDSGAKENLVKETNNSANVPSNNRNVEVTESTNQNIGEDIVREKSLNSDNTGQSQENHADVKTNDTKEKIYSNTKLSNDLEKGINADASQSMNLYHPENINRVISEKDNQQDMNKSQQYLVSRDTETNIILQNNKTLHSESNEGSENNKEKELGKSQTSNKITEAVLDNEDTKGSSQENGKKGERNITENSAVNDSDGNVNETQINGDADIDDVALNVNDLEDFSGTEYDDCELMAEIDAQIGEKKREGAGNEIESNKRDSKGAKATEIDKEIVNRGVESGEKEIETGKEVKSNIMTEEPVKKKEDTEADADIKQDKITLEDLLPKEDRKSMDLDSISEEEFDFGD